VHGVSFKKRAPRAIKEIRAFAENAMVSEEIPSCMLTMNSGRTTYTGPAELTQCYRVPPTSASTPS
jgi:hypothetical protein